VLYITERCERPSGWSREGAAALSQYQPPGGVVGLGKVRWGGAVVGWESWAGSGGGRPGGVEWRKGRLGRGQRATYAGRGGSMYGSLRSRIPRFSTEAIVAALGATGTVAEAAALVGCGSSVLHERAKLDIAIRQAVRGQQERLDNSIAEAVLRHRGVLSRVAAEPGLPGLCAIRGRISQNPLLAQVYEEARYRVVDTAEGNVFNQVEAGDYGASVFVLRTLGKDRGYTERREVEAQVTHSLDAATSEHLVGLLNHLAQTQPDLVEAEFAVLDEEEKELLGQALEAAPAEQPTAGLGGNYPVSAP